MILNLKYCINDVFELWFSICNGNRLSGDISTRAVRVQYLDEYRDQKICHRLFQKKVQELYRAIDNQSVWVDRDYLTQYAELLVHKLKSDFEKGLHAEFVVIYKKLVPKDEKIFNSDSLADKEEIELGLMNLYAST